VPAQQQLVSHHQLRFAVAAGNCCWPCTWHLCHHPNAQKLRAGRLAGWQHKLHQLCSLMFHPSEACSVCASSAMGSSGSSAANVLWSLILLQHHPHGKATCHQAARAPSYAGVCAVISLHQPTACTSPQGPCILLFHGALTASTGQQLTCQ